VTSAPTLEEDLDPRPRPPDWAQLIDMVEGARSRGFTQDQIDYLRAVVGIAWAKAHRAGEAVGKAKEDLRG
jgi:hypothetical protein